MPPTLRRAVSKINLGLEVLKKREDGFHDLNTLYLKLSAPSDELHIEDADSYSLSVSGTAVSNGEDNLVTKAVRAFERETGTPQTIRVTLEKRIPSEAGLGGGSSDAAEMLKWLNRDGALPEDRLFRLGVELGADVPIFLLDSNSAVASGIGDVLRPVSVWLKSHVLVVKAPDTSVSTKEAFAAMTIQSKRKPADLELLFSLPMNWKNIQATVVNDFEPYAFAKHVILAKIKQELYDRGANFALMTGSGSAIYALFANQVIARNAQADFKARGYFAALSSHT